MRVGKLLKEDFAPWHLPIVDGLQNFNLLKKLNVDRGISKKEAQIRDSPKINSRP